MKKGQIETNDLSTIHLNIAKKMKKQWLVWQKDCNKTEWTGKDRKEFKIE